MDRDKVIDTTLLGFSAAEIVGGAIVMLFPDVFPRQIAWFFLAFGAICFLVFLYRCWHLLWDWLYAKALTRVGGASGVERQLRNVRAADSQSIRDLLNGPERDKFVALLQSGDIRAWARTNSKTYGDLRKVPLDFWNRHRIEFIHRDGSPQTILPDHSWDGGIKPWQKKAEAKEVALTSYYDAHFNKAELKSIWPNVNF